LICAWLVRWVLEVIREGTSDTNACSPLSTIMLRFPRSRLTQRLYSCYDSYMEHLQWNRI
jgi:hypothetical protein